jgi:hypothetical protein
MKRARAGAPHVHGGCKRQVARLVPGEQPHELQRLALFMHDRSLAARTAFESRAQASPRLSTGGGRTIERAQVLLTAERFQRWNPVCTEGPRLAKGPEEGGSHTMVFLRIGT